MSSHKRFNNLLYSITCVLLVLLGIAVYAFFLHLFSKNQNPEGRTISYIVWSVLLIPGLIFFSVLTVIHGFDYFVITPNEIVYKKLFQWKRIIQKQDVCLIEKTEVFALIPSVYRTDAYVISSKDKKIPIFINEKNKTNITKILEEYGYMD